MEEKSVSCEDGSSFGLRCHELVRVCSSLSWRVRCSLVSSLIFLKSNLGGAGVLPLFDVLVFVMSIEISMKMIR